MTRVERLRLSRLLIDIMQRERAALLRTGEAMKLALDYLQGGSADPAMRRIVELLVGMAKDQSDLGILWDELIAFVTPKRMKRKD